MDNEKSVRFERHHDDVWIDEITYGRVPAPEGPHLLHIETVPRYKTSGLSGDEWRVSARVTLTGAMPALPVYCSERFLNVDKAVLRLPMLPYDSPAHAADWGVPAGTLRLWRKGRLVLEREYGTMVLAVSDLPWVLCLRGESRDWRDVDTDALCFQPGCAAPATTEYRLKRLFARDGDALPADKYYHHHRRFCARHAERGDCGLDDSDSNYEVISGHGPAGAQSRPEDESRAKLVMVSGEQFLADPKGTVDAAVDRGGDRGRDG